MFYFYTLAVPAIIMGVAYYITTPKPKNFSAVINMLFKSLPFLFAYGVLLYFLETGNHIEADWSYYSYLFFLVPIAIIISIFKISYFIRNKKKAANSNQ